MPGIGDEADQEDGNIFIRKGDNWVDINLVKLNDPAQNVKPMQTAAKDHRLAPAITLDADGEG